MTSFSKPAQHPHTEVKVRAVVPADLPRLIEIARQSEMAAHWSAAEYEKLFADEASGHCEPSRHEPGHPVQSRRTALVIEQAHEIAGFIVGHAIGAEWEIENIVVAEAVQRGGFGSRLLGEFLNMVRGCGGQAVFLEVRESNLAARALYGKYGFAETGRRKMYYENPPEDALILRFNF
jgi:ribosomal-protein-alanine N-acetyltransferase